ncbi:hypothetical protein MKX03_021591 [Papaver bracteatum]|nr:hypothetical protein MKX03_021591 [Papaver bracteatum]
MEDDSNNSQVLSNKKVYRENCSGCQVEHRKDTETGIPYKIWIATVGTALPISSIFPFLYFMIRDFQIATKVKNIGYYAGCIGSAYMFGRALTSYLWGIFADRYGRKPVLIFGTITVIIFNTLFGLSTNFWMAVSMRFLLGSLNGLFSAIMAYATEVCSREHQPLGLSLISAAWGVGLVIGPALGGLISQPAEKYPRLFPQGSIFAKFPYFLPCLCISVFATASLVSCFMLPETLHTHAGIEDEDEEDKHRNVEKELMQESTDGTGFDSKKIMCQNWPLISSIIAYCVFSLHDSAYAEIFPMWAVSPRDYGGLSFTTKNIGQILSFTGIGLLLFQFTLYPAVERILGYLNVARIATVLTIILLASYPLMAQLSGLTLLLVLNCASILKNVFSLSIDTGFYILQNNAVSQDQRGAANGITVTAMSLFKAVGPAFGGAMFSCGQSRRNAAFLPGSNMIFFFLNVIEAIALLMSFKPFLALPKQHG